MIRLWSTTYVVDAGTAQRRQLWNGMVSLERPDHPAGVVTVANTGKDFDAPARSLAQSVSGQRLLTAIRQRGNLPVLLVW